MEPHDYLRHTLDPVRLAILGSAILAPVDAEAIAGVLGVRRQKVLRSIVRLTEVGLLDPDGKLDVDVLISIGAQLPDIEAAAAGITDGTWDAEEPRCSDHFLRDLASRRYPPPARNV